MLKFLNSTKLKG